MTTEQSSIRVFITDDEPKAIATLIRVFELYFDHIEVVGIANGVNEACEKLKDIRPDVLFLDIEMGDALGFDLLEKLEDIDFHVVFLTAHEEYALKAIKISALDYIIKPAGAADLKALWEKVRKAGPDGSDRKKVRHMFANFTARDRSEHKITIPTVEGYEFLRLGDLLYIRADGSYTHLTTKDGQILTSSRNLKFYESVLDGYGFYRIHNSTLINMKYIKRFHKSAGGYVVMENGVEFSISKSRKDAFLNQLSV